MHLFCTIILLSFYSCGKQEFPDYTTKEEDFTLIPIPLYLKGTIRPLNRNPVRGAYFIRAEDDQLYVSIDVTRLPEDIRIQQHVHAGPRCPGPYSDLDRDGTIDYNEILVSSGEPLMALDKSLSSELEGNAVFPIADENGKYFYTGVGSIRSLRSDLVSRKLLGSSAELHLRDRTIIFFGSAEGPLAPIGCAEL